MRVSQRQTSDHIVIGRALADKTIIEPREPQLIKLGLPLPSVPVLTPLLSPLVGGSNSNQNSGSGSGSGTTTTAAPPPAQTTSSGGSSGSGGGSSGGSTGGSSSGGTGGGSSTSNPGSGGTSSSGGGTSSGDPSSSGGTSSSAGDSSGNTSSPGGSTSSGGSTDSGSSSGDSSSSGSTSGNASSTGNGTSTSDSSASQGGNGSTITSGGVHLSGDGSGNGTSGSDGGASSGNASSTGDAQHSTGSGSGGVANAGGIPGGTSASGSHSTNGKDIPNPTQIGGISTTTGVGGVSGGSTGGSGGSKHGLSGGAIAGISICLLALLVGLVIFFVRRRTRSLRHDQANHWWFTGKRLSQTYGDRNSKEILAPGVRTARSSFATTVDHSDRSDRNHSPIARNSFIIPPLPPMAEIGRANGNLPVLAIENSNFASSLPVISDGRFSVSSRVSAETESQYLVVHHRDSLNPGTPMSVRPFSPSESFSFPRPPDPVGDRNSAYSRPSSSGTLAKLQAGTHFSFHSSSIPPTPGLPTLTINLDNPINSLSDPFADNNPFENPAPPEPFYASENGAFAETEFICRPFVPTLSDELAVRPDDPVRILKTFDDGWALVEKVRPDDPKGSRGGEGVERGLIPIDCLRAPGQALPAFFAAKRVSSYAGSIAGNDIHAL